MNPSASATSLRSGVAVVGRIVLFVLLAMALAIAADGVAGLVAGPEGLEYWLDLAAALAATWIMLRFVDRARWADVGLGRDHARPRLVAEGWVLGMLAIGVPALLITLVGWLRFEETADGSWWGAALKATVLLAPAAVLEEVLVRGYPFALLRRRWGGTTAVVATSAVFGVLHVWNPGATALSIALVTLAGLFLGAVVLVTGSVWVAGSAHLAWNWTMAVLLHTAVSGIPFALPDYRLADRGPDWVTGGVWGPEGGVGAGAGMLGGIAYLISRRRRRQEIADT